MSSETSTKAAKAILDGLRAQRALLAESDAAVLAELAASLEAHSAALRAVAERVPASAPSRWDAFLDAVAREGLALDDDALEPLAAELARVLDASEHVDELFLDDDALLRTLRAALLDFVSEEKELLLASLRRDTPKREREKPKRKATLAEEGFAFALFDAPRSDATLDEAGPCCACGTEAPVRFARGCYACFRAGKLNHAIDTELGAVFSESAETGWTQGLPKGTPHPPGHEERLVTDVDDDDPWVQLHVEPRHLVELSRTPKYATWQGERWLFCCQEPMVFKGRLDASDFVDRPDGQSATDYAGKLFGLGREAAEEMLDELMNGHLTGYLFRCRACGGERAHVEQS